MMGERLLGKTIIATGSIRCHSASPIAVADCIIFLASGEARFVTEARLVREGSDITQ